MTVHVWRIATEGKTYHANDLSGEGAKRSGGRWNDVGIPVVYTAMNISLACLETVVHLDDDLPLNRYLVRIDIPDDVWAASDAIDPGLIVGWDAMPAGMASVVTGSQWLLGGSSALLRVPSVIVPEEGNVLINPTHAAAATITATALRKWTYDPRL